MVAELEDGMEAIVADEVEKEIGSEEDEDEDEEEDGAMEVKAGMGAVLEATFRLLRLLAVSDAVVVLGKTVVIGTVVRTSTGDRSE